jgi:membrane protein required for colicin V production
LNLLDIIIALIAVIGFILGYKDGFIRKLIGLIGFGLGIFLAVKFAGDLGKILEKIFGIEFYLSEIIAGIIIFLLIIFLSSVIKRVVHPFDKVNNLINQIVGGAIGAIQILFFASALLFLMNIFNAPSKKIKESSFLYKRVYNIVPSTVDYLNNYTPKTKEIIKNYINEKDTTQ